jgi:MGT family glycosyltransferase
VTLLVISPDYASHAVPLITLAAAWRRRGHRVVVASGRAVEPIARRAGMEHAELEMSRGSNPGVIRDDELAAEEARSLESFFEATRAGMLETLRYQALARTTDLLWQPESVARRTIRLVETIRPDTILVDHLAFAATIGLRAMDVPYGDVVLGHPTALPVEGETYGVPTAWPDWVRAEPVELDSLRATARGVSDAFTFAHERVLRRLDPSADPVPDAFAAHGDLVLYNYPAGLHDSERMARLPRHVFLGSAVRDEVPPPDVEAWLEADDPRPLVVVSFGTFLSARTDVLARVAAALQRVDARVALATGAAATSDLGVLPDEWLVRPSLPQVALLERASVLVTHGGNNSVTEALHFGVPLVVMPFSTDQFDGAAAIERHAAGVALDPNRAPRPLIAGSVRGLLRHPPTQPSEISRELRARSGPEIAYVAMTRTLADPSLSTPLPHRHAAATAPGA